MPPPRHGLLAMLAFSAAWATLCLSLHAAGHGPSHPTLPVAPADYYRFQAAALAPTLLLGWLLFAALTDALARKLGGAGRMHQALGGLGLSYGLAGLLGFALPELLTFTLWGFDALLMGMLVYGPLCLLALLAGSTRVAARVYGLSTGRAALAVSVAFLLQALPVSVVLR